MPAVCKTEPDLQGMHTQIGLSLRKHTAESLFSLRVLCI